MRIRELDWKSEGFWWVFPFHGICVVRKPIVYGEDVSGNCAHRVQQWRRPTFFRLALHAVVVREDVRDAIPVPGVTTSEHLDPWVGAEYGHDIRFGWELDDDLAALLAVRMFRRGILDQPQALDLQGKNIPCLRRTRTRAHASCQA